MIFKINPKKIPNLPFPPIRINIKTSNGNCGCCFIYKSFNSNSWFWKYLKNDKKYYSIEVYNGDPKKLRRLQKLTIQKLI